MMTVRIPVPDGELYGECAGSGPPVVLLHAGILDASMWDDQFDALAAEHTVIRYDARSHGRSSTATTDFRPDEDLRAVLDHLEIPSATLVGNSYGGATATSFALMHPDRVDSLVLAGPGITPVEFRDPFVRECHRKQAEAAEAADADGYVDFFLRFAVDGPYRSPDEVDRATRRRCRAMAERTVRAHHTATGAILERDAMSGLDTITAPTLLVMGELDLPDLHRIADTAAERMPSARKFVLPGCGHMMNMERPTEFTQLVSAHARTAVALPYPSVVTE